MDDEGGPAAPHLHNLDGSVFDQLEEAGALLSILENDERIDYRNANAEAIACSTATHLLVVAGPGSGKSHLFMGRAKHWLHRDTESRVLISTFVRKLVKDLRTDMRKLSTDARGRVEATTIHGVARGIVESAMGSPSRPRRKHVRMIDGFWAPIVWDDVMAFHPTGDLEGHDRREFEHQLHSETPDPTEEWPWVRDQYEVLCRFYNASGFADLIAMAVEAVEDDPDLAAYDYWIVDEYQDLNACEDHLVAACTLGAAGVLLAGDDEQALYQEMKLSMPEIIVGYYEDPTWAKGMLPFCSRCAFHICRAASAFIAQHRGATAIAKLYLPLEVDPAADPVNIVGTAAPTSALQYVRKFLDDHSADYAEYMQRREVGEDTDPFLLILSQSGLFSMSKSWEVDHELEVLLAEYSEPGFLMSADYRQILGYCIAGWDGTDNFSVRKVLEFEKISPEEVHTALATAIDEGRTLMEVVAEHHPEIRNLIRRVTVIVEAYDENPEAALAQLAEAIDLQDAEVLAQELAERPIKQAGARDFEDEEAVETAKLVPPVTAMSIVGSKGLSAHHVIVLGCDTLNLGRVSPLAFFVAMTRARRSLHLVTSGRAGGDPHPYLGDLPPAECQYLFFTKDGTVTKRRDWPDLSGYLAWLKARGRPKSKR